MAFPGDGRRGQASRHLRLRCRRAHYCPGGALAGAFGLCIHADGDVEAQRLAISLGADWAGGSEARPPAWLDAAIIYAPVGALVPLALRAVRKGGRVVCAGIHMSDIPSFPYNILWEERQLLSVANLTRNDGIEFFKIAAQAGIKTHTAAFPLREANEVLSKLRAGQITGAAVLRP
jgi:propanol-preferring alcohol dehydrogenase